MLDIKFIRENKEIIKEVAKIKCVNVDIDKLIELDNKRRKYIGMIDKLREEKKKISKKIPITENKKILLAEAKRMTKEEKELEKELNEVEIAMQKIIEWIPNVFHPSVPDEPIIVREYNTNRNYDFNQLTAYELCKSLDIIDFEAGAKIAGSNFPCYKRLGALLERALINFMLDVHIKQGYIEVFTPFLVSRKSMFGTAQLPKYEEDMYLVEKDDLFLNPTAEVPIINIHREEILKNLPIKYVGYTACFRREAGSYGKETKGLKRVHQFNKVELIKFVEQENSDEELEKMVNDAEEVLKLLDLTYRVVLLPKKELSFASMKTYDIEVWAPGSKEYLEVSSCSNCGDFQARRIRVRYKKNGKNIYPHILNGSGIATPRTFIAIIEQYCQEDGTIKVPDALLPYMHGIKVIK